MDIDISTYWIHHLLKTYIEQVKCKDANSENSAICLDDFRNNLTPSFDGKKNQLIDQLISEAIVHFTTCVWEKKEQKIAGDILRDLSRENGRRKPYGTLIQDSRRR